MSEWLKPGFAESWSAQDGLANLLALPRQLAADVVAAERPNASLVIDIGSGPGDFLELMLTAFPAAAGVWNDLSPVMEELARTRLAPLGSRVSYLIGDMADVSGLPSGADVVVTSRASHHLSPTQLVAFYRGAAGLLAPGGWLVNLDHVELEPTWEARLRASRKRLVPPKAGSGAHHHDGRLPTADEHLAALAGAGVVDVETPWRAFYTYLFMGRRPPLSTA
jgi:trans-aconitate methyltransferase